MAGRCNQTFEKKNVHQTFEKKCLNHPAMFCLITSSKFSRQLFEVIGDGIESRLSSIFSTLLSVLKLGKFRKQIFLSSHSNILKLFF